MGKKVKNPHITLDLEEAMAAVGKGETAYVPQLRQGSLLQAVTARQGRGGDGGSEDAGGEP